MRLAGRTRLGFYPLPLPEAERIRRFLAFPDKQCCALDPCVGDGAAFTEIASDKRVLRYGIELDSGRAEQARSKGINVTHGNCFVQKEARSRILKAVRKKLPPSLARADLEMVALDYFRRLGHDNHHRLFQVYGWEEKKTKTSWGGNSVDHEKLAEARICRMTAGDRNRFVVTCVLVPYLYCPGYSSAGTLSKENLIRTAVRYKVDASKITAGVTAELSARRKRPQGPIPQSAEQGKIQA